MDRLMGMENCFGIVEMVRGALAYFCEMECLTFHEAFF